MNQKNIKNPMYIAAFCFTIQVIACIYSLISFPLDYFQWIGLISALLVVIALIVPVPALATAGFAIKVVLYALLFIGSILSAFLNPYLTGIPRISNFLSNAFSLSISLLLMLASIKKPKAKKFSFAAAAVSAISFPVGILMNFLLTGSSGLSMATLLLQLVIITGAVCFGITYEGMAKHA